MSEITDILSQDKRLAELVRNPALITRELNNRSLYHFLQYFWDTVSSHTFVHNWHIEYLCSELERIAHRVGRHEESLYDLIINVPPGTTKTITCSIMFPAWCWTRYHWMRFITASYSLQLSLESAEYCRDLIRSDKFREIYPELEIREDKNTKSNYRIAKRIFTPQGNFMRSEYGGNRFSTSVGGTLTGFHGDILVWDDPLNPNEAASEKELANTNRWIDEVLPTRKTNKAVSTIVGIMQRLHQDDPTGHVLAKEKKNLKHICLPGEVRSYKQFLKPAELIKYYEDDLLDVNRLTWKVLENLESDLGQYSFAGQIGQNPVPPGGGMFHVDCFSLIDDMVDTNKKNLHTIRYWDKASTADAGTYTVGVKMTRILNKNKFVIEDVKRGQWSTETREHIIKTTAEADGKNVVIYVEQEPGSGGKDSVQGTISNLAGFSVYADKPSQGEGDKPRRADRYSVQVNNGNVMMLRALWNREFIEEHRYFPFSKYLDQVDAAAGAFNKLTKRRIVRRIT